MNRANIPPATPTPPAGQVEFSSAGAYSGDLGMRVRCGGTGGPCAPNWQSASLGTITTDHYSRFFLKMDVLAATNDPIFQLLNAALTTQPGVIRLFAAGNLDI